MGALDDREERIRDGLLALFDQLLAARRGRQPVPVGIGLAVSEQDGGPQRVPLAAVDEERDDARPFLGADADERRRWPGNHRASRSASITARPRPPGPRRSHGASVVACVSFMARGLSPSPSAGLCRDGG